METTWEPADNCTGCAELVFAFERAETNAKNIGGAEAAASPKESVAHTKARLAVSKQAVPKPAVSKPGRAQKIPGVADSGKAKQIQAPKPAKTKAASAPEVQKPGALSKHATQKPKAKKVAVPLKRAHGASEIKTKPAAEVRLTGT